ncbi:pyridoxal phosphate-dependent aminotransferase [Loktanella sp. M215]|uniref:pyridoxal phosphate-dependent aminotransferase n=1 Tax=Loktanella sp. M215 TaxID=2675431 RepID=UPI001F008987|nr:aminotransferase class I/II-fold pyridoxal phosphate-dependent enzyme [Loktanella sp. M215]MCF7700163.1 aminotransferase class I/II-fold pyridoxal phosphate-dependent enzyme [Loktanella sp. M215]
MKMSSRIQNITGGGSDGWAVYYRARAMKAAGLPVVQLTMGEHDIGTDRAILDAMNRSAVGGNTGYALVVGNDDLRAAVADRIATRTGVPTGPENIVIMPGGQAALFAAHHAACDPGDTALFIDPYYATYPGTIRAVGAVPRAIQVHADHGFQPQRPDLEDAAKGATSLLINSPNNPTGAVYGADTMDDIAGVCQDHDLWLISDEVYDTQVWEGEHISPRALPGMAERTLVVNSLSKSHAMTGSRIGWICGPADVVDAIHNLATHNTYGVAGFVQDAAVFALSQGAAAEEAVAAPFRRRRQIVLDALAGQNAIRAAPISGAMYAMLDIRATGMDGETFANALLNAELIGVMPGESFGQGGAGHIRVAMTVDDARLGDAVRRIAAFAATRID